MYAIIEACGRQYKVKKGDIVYFDKLNQEEGKKISFDKVLFVEGEEFGMPYVKGAKVEAKIIKDVKGEELNIFRYKRKKNFRKRQGHRQTYSKVEILDIVTASKKAAVKEEKIETKKEEKKAKKVSE